MSDPEFRPTSEGRDPGALEDFWAGEFGSEWLARNDRPSDGRRAFWAELVAELGVRNALELGCGGGVNLACLAEHLPATALWGVDINTDALRAAARLVPDAGLGWAAVRSLPFRDRFFDLTFTVGVLIHQPDETLPVVLGELVRTSNRWIVTAEYHAEDSHTKPYRGQEGVLFKRDYAARLTTAFPEVEHIRGWEAGPEHGFDRTQIDVFRRH